MRYAPIILAVFFILLFTLARNDGGAVPDDVLPEFKNLSLSHISGICGNDICEQNEDHLSCPQDCIEDLVNLDQIFCEPMFRCGNWLVSPTITTILLLTVVFGLLFYIRRKR